jgi:hypothetical protein
VKNTPARAFVWLQLARHWKEKFALKTEVTVNISAKFGELNQT